MKQYGMHISPESVRVHSGRTSRTVAVLACGLLAATVLSACSIKSQPTNKSTTSNSQGHNSAKVEGTVPPGSVPIDTTTTLPKAEQAAGAACTHGQVNITQVSSGIYQSMDVGVFAVTNVSNTRCSLNGFPTFLVFGHDGPLPSNVTQGNVAGTSGLTQATVTLAPKGQASFAVSWNPNSSTGNCPDGTGAIIGLPGITSTYTVQTIITACGGTLNVSPIQPNVIVTK
jgi:hypothetical protein